MKNVINICATCNKNRLTKFTSKITKNHNDWQYTRVVRNRPIVKARDVFTERKRDRTTSN